MAEQYISVGKLGKPHGISGAFRFLLYREVKGVKKFPSFFFVQHKGSYMPWFISEVELLSNTEGFINFEDITSPESARKYSGQELYLTEKEITAAFKKEGTTIQEYKGYKAVDVEFGEIGIIEEILENPGQALCLVKQGDKEYFIPFVDGLIMDIDKRRKLITFDLPEGLLDI